MTATRSLVLLPELLYHDDAFRTGLGLDIDVERGRILRVVAEDEVRDRDVVRLRGRALVPGFVNAHSHAFQRLIRGRTQWRPTDERRSDFWSWREEMYGATLRLSPDDVYAVSRFCFMEMLLAGITTVGEFHYLHNDTDGRPYDDERELALRVLDAAADVGIRIRLLNTCYATGAIGQPLLPEQRRFGTPDLDRYIRNTEALADTVAESSLASVGVAPHSVRAVPRDWLRPLHAFAQERDLPFHMHVSEQPAEVEASIAVYGLRPVQLLAEEGVLDARFTAVHGTHIADEEVSLFGEARAVVCACPATERDLGDGYLRAHDLLHAGAGIALGTDSQTVIDLLEEARLVEYTERLRRLQRVMLTRRSGETLEAAPVLMDMMTRTGARALRLNSGTFEAGAAADAVAIDLGHPTLAGWTPATLAALLTLSAPAAVIADVWVGGRQVVQDGAHARAEDVTAAFTRVAAG